MLYKSLEREGSQLGFAGRHFNNTRFDRRDRYVGWGIAYCTATPGLFPAEFASLHVMFGWTSPAKENLVRKHMVKRYVRKVEFAIAVIC